jgi:predicted flap endonuclease-1-like 5' DNA nuclease
MVHKLGSSALVVAAWPVLSGFSPPLTEGEPPITTGAPLGIWILVILGFLAIAVMIWWWWRNAYRRGETEESVERSEPMATAQGPGAGESEAVPPSPATAAEGLKPDDLKRIEGIGPKIAAVLDAAGVRTFAQLADTDADRLREILGEQDPNLLRLADPTTWPEQAALAKEGEWEALAELQESLKGGRRS